MASKHSPRSWRAISLAALVVFFMVGTLGAQGPYAAVDLLGMGCGTPTPAINSTLPVFTMPLTIFVSNAPPNSPLVLAITMPPDPPLLQLAPGCFLWVTPTGTPEHPPFFFSGATNADGVFSITFPPALLLPFAPGAVCNAQAVILNGSAGSINLPFGFPGFVTNGIALTMGDQPPNTNPGGPNPPRTYIKTEFGGNGPGGQLLLTTFGFAFPLGLEIGDYNTSMGACPPNGKLWNTSGLNAFRTYLLTGGGISGSFDMDALNTSQDCGGGPLGRHTAALALNIRFHDLGLLGGVVGRFGNILYIDATSSLHMETIDTIFAAAQSALAGFALPAGYSFVTLSTLIEQFNLAFHNPQMPSMFAGMHLFNPTP